MEVIVQKCESKNSLRSKQSTPEIQKINNQNDGNKLFISSIERLANMPNYDKGGSE